MPVSARSSSKPQPAKHTPVAPPSRAWTWVKRGLLGLLLLLISMLLMAWMALQWVVLPRMDSWRPLIEARVSRALGLDVRIAAIDVGPGYWNRVLTLREIAFKDARGEDALHLQQVQLALSPASLLPRSFTSWTPRFHQVTIDQPRLEARRSTDGRIYVAGMDLSAGSAGPEDTRATDWLFSQGRFTIHGGTLSWTDEFRQAPILELRAVEVDLRNRLNSHELRIEATPPEAWGTRFSLGGDFKAPLITDGALAREGDWRHWRGSLQAKLPDSDLRELQRHVTLPVDLQEGRGAWQLKAEIDAGRIESISVDVSLQDVQMKCSPQLDPLRLRQLVALIEARRGKPAPGNTPSGSPGAERLELSVHGLRFTTGDGVVWPASDLFLALQRDAAGTVVGGEAQAQRLDLAVLAQLAGRVPLAEPLKGWVEQGKPQGLIQPLRMTWTGPLEAPQRYSLGGQATGLTLQGTPPVVVPVPAVNPALVGPPPPLAAPPLGRPGLRNAAVEFSATEVGGQARIAVERGALDLPGLFEEPLVPVDRLDAQVLWRITPHADASALPDVEVQVREARFANADVQGELNGQWRTGKGQGPQHSGYLPGWVDLEVQLARANAARVARYLPLGLPESARHYVAGAARAGQLKNTTARVRGNLADFPFAGRADSEFKIRTLLEDASFAYVPGTAQQPSPWPAFTHLRGELIFDRQGMEIRNAQARVAGVGSGLFQLSAVNGGVKDFARDPVLTLDGQGRGLLADALQYLEATPLGEWVGHPLAKSSAQGDASLQLALKLPLHDLATTTVRGTVQLPGNELRVLPGTPLLSNLRGRVEFSEQGFSVRGATLRTLGGDASLEGGTQSDGTIRLTGEGIASAEALRNATELGLVTRFAASTSGSTAYRLNLAIVRGQPELQVTSSLVGLGSTLPVPFAKTAEQSLPLRVEMRPLAAAGPKDAPKDTAKEPPPRDPQRDQIRIELGTVLQAQVQRDLSGPEARILRGGIGVGEPAPAPDSGLEVAVNLPSASLDAWRQWVEAPTPGRPAGADHGGAANPALPDRTLLKVRELQAFGRKLTAVNATVTRAPRERDGALPWRVQIEADQMSGRIEYRDGATATEGRVFARLSRLSLPQSDATVVENLLDQTTSVPALDVVIDDFELRGKRLGRLEIEAVNRGGGDGTPREWALSKFNLHTPEANLTATGTWTPVSVVADPATRIAGRRRTALAFQLSLSDSGATLSRMGLGGTLRGGKGRLTGDIAWFGSPLSPDYPSLSGNLKLALDAGQFLKAEPGAARLLGVLNLQALPRRLLLDFRDVFQEGFSFDSLEGDVTIAQGVASTRNLRIRSVQAVVLMEGRADVARETQDLRVWVVPEINAGTASLAYAIINPAVGLGTFLGQLFLRKPLIEANTREFHITGPWADPKVERVERKAGSRVPSASAGDVPATPATQ